MVVRKRFGQHFLQDPAVIARLVDAVSPRAGERIVEIGPGRGALTLPLLERGALVHAIEIDRDLAATLRRRPVPAGAELTVIEADALRFDLDDVANAADPVRVVANLPYNISTPILFRLLGRKHLIRDFHLMLQKEVVDRMVAPPGSRAYGRLSVMVQVHCDATPLFDIGPDAFQPPPRVWSSVVRLEPTTRFALSAAHLAAFEQLVIQCFSRRRKTLRNATRGLVDADTLSAIGLDVGARPETISVAEFVHLAGTIAMRSGGDHADTSC